MFDRLIEWIINILDIFRFWFVVDQYEAGIVLRLGKFNREVGPGLHFKWFIFEDEQTTNTNMTTLRLNPQTVMSLDSKSMVAQAIIKYKISNVKLFFLEVWSARDALRDITAGAVRTVISANKYEGISKSNGSLEKTVLELVRRECNELGFKILKITFETLGPIKSLRLIQDAAVEGTEED